MLVKLAYFSGTGGTKRIAECATAELIQQGCKVDLERIDRDANHVDAFKEYDLLILLSVVHEFNFPHPVREWVATLEKSQYPQAAVFNVSGGGRAVGNRGAQKIAIDALEEQGIPVFFDETFVLPSNFFYRIKHPVDAMELAAYPVMVKQAISQVLAKETKRPKTPLLDRVVTRCFRNSWKHTHKFGSAITVSDNCTACKICVGVCPVKNIELNPGEEKPTFSDECVFCLACLYACPFSALEPGRDAYALLKDGYDLIEIEQREYDPSAWDHIETLCKGYLYSGVKEYLLEARPLLFPEKYTK